VRLFIAINLPPDHRRAIYEAAAPLRAAAGGVTWVGEDRLHVTLKFLGEQPEEAVATVDEALREVVAQYRPMTLELGGVGAFPSLRSPRVVYLGITPEAKLELLHHDVESACASLGYDIDGHAFRPHITLGRVKRELGGRAASSLASAAEAVQYADEVEVRSVDVMSSVLSRSGPAYSVVAALPLRAA
jgi:2'-5' RNA ligase